MKDAEKHMDWQLIVIAWGDKYGAQDINQLIAGVRAHATGLQRIVLITDRPRPGLADGVTCVDHPREFLDEALRRSGCQAKLAMFKPGVVPDDMPAIFVDLDTIVLGDLSALLAQHHDPRDVSIFQSAIVPFGPIGRWLWRNTGKRKYARGNSSIVVFHPAHCGYIAQRFMELWAPARSFAIRPMIADERFISWVAQPHMHAIPKALAVKFPTEFMYPWLWLGRLIGAMPNVRARRDRLIAVTLPGEAVKAEVLLSLPEGAEVRDRKGRRMIWSDAFVGPVRKRMMDALARAAAAARPKD